VAHVGPTHHLAAWLRRHELEVEQARRLARILVETGHTLNDARPNPRAAPNDPARLRGLPAVGGRGLFGGAIRGTLPHIDGLR
jgi:hypothetical protein